MRRLETIRALCACSILLIPGSAWANQPPAPQSFLGTLAILPVMALFTALAAGYAVMRARDPRTTRWWRVLLKIFGAVILFVSGAAFIGTDILVSLIFGAYALYRSGQLIHWAILARRPPLERPAYLQRATAWRLALAGGLNTLAVGVLVGASFAFFGWWPSDDRVERELVELVAFQLAAAELAAEASATGDNGAPQFRAPSETAEDGYVRFDERVFWIGSPIYAADHKLGADRRSFVVRAWPKKLPAFPYNLLVSQPSFYADQRGELRAVEVHDTGIRCPPEAPVVRRVERSDVERALTDLRRRRPDDAPAAPLQPE